MHSLTHRDEVGAVSDVTPAVHTGESMELKRQRRRKTVLEMISLAIPNAAAVFFSGHLVAEWGAVTAGMWAALTATVSGGYWTWHRGRYPARVGTTAMSGQERHSPRREMAEDAGPIWDPVNLLVVAVGAVAVVTVVVIGTLVAFLLPLMIILIVGVVAGGGDMGGVGSAAFATLGVAVVIEAAVVLPLSKLWGLSMDDEGPGRDEFCPPSVN